MAPRVFQFMCLQDNFGVLVHDPETRRTASIDAPEAGPILEALADHNWELTDILFTHHHGDHTQGLPGVRERFPSVRLVGPAKEASKLPKLDVEVGEGDFVMVGSLKAQVLETPGHTSGHISYYFKQHDLLFTGDTLFALGCGRPMEEPPHVLYRSLLKLARLPGSVQVYCGHEYTEANARFALSVDGDNDLLRNRATEISNQRQRNEATLPTTIAIERATNPFLRAEEPEIKAAVGMANSDGVDVFAELRDRKNRS